MKVPITFFFEPSAKVRSRGVGNRAQRIFNFMATADSIRIAKAFHRIKSPKARELLVNMAEQLVAGGRPS